MTWTMRPIFWPFVTVETIDYSTGGMIVVL